ncbi:MAG: TonB-dependent receptor [Candidatus Lernaella stagnicola]|nr:TonB-dependent receptor [Candidatus Lernaella stagnicola]
MKYLLPLLMCICLSCGLAWADDSDSEDDSEPAAVTRDEVVVTANRGREVDFLSDRSLSILSMQRLKEITPRTTPEALWDTPGTYVQTTNYGGGSPIIRGLIGPQVLIMLDGVRLNNSTYRTGPVQYLNMIDPYSISRVEVLRGPGSVLYGSDAMGGVIQLFPLAPRQYDEFDGHGTVAGRFNSADYGRRGHAHAEAGYGPVALLGGGTYGESDDLIGGRDIGEQVYTGYENWSAIGRLNLTFGHWGVSAGTLFHEIVDAGRTDKYFDKGSLSLYDNRDQLVYGKINAEFLPIHTRAEAIVSYQLFFERKDGVQFAEDLRTEQGTTRDEVNVGTIGTDLALATSLLDDRFILRYGGMWYFDNVDANREKRDAPGELFTETPDKPYPDGSTYANYGAYLMAQGDPVSTESGHILRLKGGARYHGMRGIAPEENDLPEVDFDFAGAVFLGGLQYLYDPYATVAFTYSQGFRSPNLQEAIQLGDTGKYFHIPNEDLEPETADTFELLARGRIWRFEIGSAAYVTYLHDLINREETSWRGETEIGEKPVVQNVNGGEGRLWGLEPQLFVDVGGGLSLSGHLTYTWGEEDRLDDTTEPLTRIPPLFGQALVRYDTADAGFWRGFIEVYGRGAGRQERLSPEDTTDARIPEDGTPEWWTWNVRTGLVAYEHLRLGLAVENLTNVEYKYHGSGVFGPGTNALLTADLSF